MSSKAPAAPVAAEETTPVGVQPSTFMEICGPDDDTLNFDKLGIKRARIPHMLLKCDKWNTFTRDMGGSLGKAAASRAAEQSFSSLKIAPVYLPFALMPNRTIEIIETIRLRSTSGICLGLGIQAGNSTPAKAAEVIIQAFKHDAELFAELTEPCSPLQALMDLKDLDYFLQACGVTNRNMIFVGNADSSHVAFPHDEHTVLRSWNIQVPLIKWPEKTVIPTIKDILTKPMTFSAWMPEPIAKPKPAVPDPEVLKAELKASQAKKKSRSADTGLDADGDAATAPAMAVGAGTYYNQVLAVEAARRQAEPAAGAPTVPDIAGWHTANGERRPIYRTAEGATILPGAPGWTALAAEENQAAAVDHQEPAF